MKVEMFELLEVSYKMALASVNVNYSVSNHSS